jgi:homoserine kinase
VVSGAGPTVLVLGTGEGPRLAVREVLERMDAQSRWQALCLVVDTLGATAVTDSRDH